MFHIQPVFGHRQTPVVYQIKAHWLALIIHPRFQCLTGLQPLAVEDVFPAILDEHRARFDKAEGDLPGGALYVNSMQIFLTYDHDAIEFRRAEGAVDWTINDKDELLSAVWAADADVRIADDEAVLTVYFAAKQVAPDMFVPITFTTGALDGVSAVSYTSGTGVTEIEAVTVDGGFLFEGLLYGDANLDGQVTSADAALILRSLVGLSEITMRGAINADVDGDGEVSAADAAAILRYVVGLIKAFEVENAD